MNCLFILFICCSTVVTRLVYFLFSDNSTDPQSTSFSVLDGSGVTAPSSEEVSVHIKPGYFGATNYNPLPTNSTKPYPAYSAHSLLLRERPLGDDTLDEIKTGLQASIDLSKDTAHLFHN